MDQYVTNGMTVVARNFGDEAAQGSGGQTLPVHQEYNVQQWRTQMVKPEDGRTPFIKPTGEQMRAILWNIVSVRG